MPILELFHGTNTNRLERIEKEGLDPKALKASSGEDFVYLTDHPEVAAEFSGFGTDKQGMPHEGYMTPMEGKKQNGVVLKVRVDSKWLKPDKIWGEKLKQLKNRDKMIEELAKEIFDEIDGNQILEFRVDDVAAKLAKKIIKESPDDFTEDDMEMLIEDNNEEASHIVAKREATRIVDGQLSELKKFAKGKLYQCAKKIPPEAIVEVIPAKKFLSKNGSDDRNFGNGGIDVMSSFLVRAEEGPGFKIEKFSKTLYHGSPKPIKNFDVNTGGGRYGAGLYLTPDINTAKFYAAGGRQGNAGQRIKEGTGYIYEFKVSGNAFVVYDEYEAMSELAGDHDEAGEAASDYGDVLNSKATKHLAQWVRERFNCNIIWMNEKDPGVLSPLNQVLVTDKSAIKSTKPYVEKKKKSVGFLVNL